MRRETRRAANLETGSARAGNDGEEMGAWIAATRRASLAMAEEAIADAGARAKMAAKARGASSLVAAMEAAGAEAAAEAAMFAAAEAGAAWFLAAVSNGDPAAVAAKQAAQDAGALALVAAFGDNVLEEEVAKASMTAAVRVLTAAVAKEAAREDPAIEYGAQLLAAVDAKGASARGKDGATVRGKKAAKRKAPVHAAGKGGAASGKGGTSTGKGTVAEVEAAALAVGATDEDAAAWAAVTAEMQAAVRATGGSEEKVAEWALVAKDSIAASGGIFPSQDRATKDASDEAYDLAFAAAVAKGASAKETGKAGEDASASVLNAGTGAVAAAVARGTFEGDVWEVWAEAIERALVALAAKVGAVRDKGGAAATGKGASQRAASAQAAGKGGAARGKGGVAATGKKEVEAAAAAHGAGKGGAARGKGATSKGGWRRRCWLRGRRMRRRYGWSRRGRK